jgi:hypothetical protein
VKRKQKGPVMQRREQVEEGTTTDQRLLDSRGPSDWVHTDPWRIDTVTPVRSGKCALIVLSHG